MIQNPILPGFNADPCICRKGSDYYVAVSTMEWFPGVAVYHSTNLKEWKLRTHVLNNPGMLEVLNLPSAKGLWAPCLSYCGEEDRFYLVYNVMYSQNARFFDVNNYVVTAENIEGPWTTPVYLHSAGFDGSMFHDEDGRKYIASLEWETRDGYHKPGVICLCEYDPEKESVIGYPKHIFSGATKRGCIEGPHLYKRNGWYYLLCAEGGTGYGHCVTLSRSRSVWGPYEAAPNNPILTSTSDFDEMDNSDFLKPQRYNPDAPLQKAGHGSLVETPQGEVYMTYHCGRPFLPELRCTLGRETCITKMEWTADGWLRKAGEGNIVEEFVEEPLGIPVDIKPTKQIDKWDENPIPLEYYAQRTLGDTFAHVENGRWTLRGEESLSSLHRTSLLARRLTSIRATYQATVDTFHPETYQQYAGLCIYYDNMDYILIRKVWDDALRAEAIDLLRVKNGQREEVENTRTPITNDPVAFQLCIEDRSTSFYWKQPGMEFEKLGPDFDTSEFSDEFCEAGEFTGTMVGIFCVDGVLHRKTAVFTDVEYYTMEGSNA